MKTIIEFPFQVRQVSPNTVEIESFGILPSFISPEVLKRAYPWLSDDQLDLLVDKLYAEAGNEAIRSGVRVKTVESPVKPVKAA